MSARLSTRTYLSLGRKLLLVLLLSSFITSCNRTANQQPGPSSQEQPEEMPVVDDTRQTDLPSVPAQCDMAFGFAHETRNEGVRAIYEGDGALFFTTPFAVNTDGAPNSYHPDDPYGNQGRAINTICNGVNVLLPDGERINYSNCQALVNAFREARDAGWVNASAPRVEFYGVATKGSSGDERFEPCLIPSGPYEGYFVSTTSQVNDPERGRCEQERYLNALELPFVIVPSKTIFREKGAGQRDIAVLYNPDTDVLEYAIVGDRGPSWGLGEGSVFLVKTLRKLENNPQTRRDTYNFGVSKVHALLLTNSTIDPPYTVDKIRTQGEAALMSWGGEDRFKACVAAFGDKATR